MPKLAAPLTFAQKNGSPKAAVIFLKYADHIPVRPERSTPSIKYLCKKMYIISRGAMESRQPDSSHTMICLTLTV